jgi:hypothetical protein
MSRSLLHKRQPKGESETFGEDKAGRHSLMNSILPTFFRVLMVFELRSGTLIHEHLNERTVIENIPFIRRISFHFKIFHVKRKRFTESQGDSNGKSLDFYLIF